ncbi:MAG: hypothetical protein AAB518_02435 [Patescibacteria group bacterium]
MDLKDTKDGARGVAKAEALLREVREANRKFLATTGKLGAQMESHMEKAAVIWKKTETELRGTERDAGRDAEAAAKAFFLGTEGQKSE